LGPQKPAAITVNGQLPTVNNNSTTAVTTFQPSLSPPTGKELLVVGGDVTVFGGRLAADGGAATIVSVAGPREGAIPLAGKLPSGVLPAGGTISVSGGGVLGSDGSVSGGNGGAVAVAAGDIKVDGSDNSSTAALGSIAGERGNSGAVQVAATGSVMI